MIRTRWALATVLATCLLGACSDDDPEPDIADPTSSASSSSAAVSPSPTVSATPTLGPEDTVKAWVDARNSALQDGDTTEVDGLSSADCRSCEELNKVIRDVYAAGGSFDTAGWTIDSMKLKAETDPIEIDTALTFAPGQTVPSAGADPVPYDKEEHIVTFRLVGTEGSYKVQVVILGEEVLRGCPDCARDDMACDPGSQR